MVDACVYAWAFSLLGLQVFGDTSKPTGMPTLLLRALCQGDSIAKTTKYGRILLFHIIRVGCRVIGGVLQGIHNSKRQSPPPLNKKFSLGGSITREQLSHIQAENRKRGTALQHCVELNNRGIAYEKMGKIEDAIATYEINISIGYTAHHAYKRLMILYRKQKDYHNERRVIIRALEVFPAEMEYLDRLRKVEYLILKSGI